MEVDTRYPYWYLCNASFTNRKHRSRELSVAIPPDADFVAEKVGITFLMLPPDSLLVDIKGVGSFRNGGHVVPMVRFEAGSQITLKANLMPHVQIGRQRPMVQIMIEGFKVFKR